MVSSDFLLISWRDRLYSVKRKAKKEQTQGLSSVVQHSQPILTAGDRPLLTFGMVFVQLISRLLPFLNPVLERCDQAFHEGTAVVQ